jgi:hypothetical protein
MKKLIALLMLVNIVGCAGSSDSSPPPPPPPPPHDVAQNMSYYGGPVLHNAKTYAIFWGSSWGSNAAGQADMENLLLGFEGSRYVSIANEYYDSSPLIATATYAGHYTDLSSTAGANGDSVSVIGSEVCRVTSYSPDSNTVYMVYTDTPQDPTAKFCAWHAYGYCNGHVAYFAYIPNLSGQADCDPEDTQTGHSQQSAAAASVTAHELMETITDPQISAWYNGDDNANAGEIGDMCAWSFYSSPIVLSNGSQWKLQMEWSNNAYTNGTGLPNLDDQWGCVYQ